MYRGLGLGAPDDPPFDVVSTDGPSDTVPRPLTVGVKDEDVGLYVSLTGHSRHGARMGGFPGSGLEGSLPSFLHVPRDLW